MTASARLLALLHALRRRALADLALRWTLRSLTLGALLVTVVLCAGLVWGPFGATPALIMLSAVTAAVIGLIGWLRQRPDVARVARLTDARLQLRERLATALTVADASGLFSGPLLDDAVAHGEHADPRMVFPLRRHRRRAGLAAAALAAAVVAALVPNPHATAQARAAADRTTVARAADAIAKQEQKAHAAAAAAATPAQKQRLQALDQALAEALRELQASQSPRQALEALSTASDQVRHIADPATAQRAGAAQAAGDALATSQLTATAGAALSAGRTAAGASALRALAGALAGASAPSQAAAAAALDQASAAASTDAGLSGPLRAAAAALRSGNAAGASAALNDAAASADGTAAAQSAEAQINEAQAAIDAARAAAAAQANAGAAAQGQGQGQGQGRGQGQGQAQGQGQGPGTAGGSGNGSGGSGHGTAAGPTDQLFVPGTNGVQEPLPGPLAPGQQIPLSDYTGFLGQYQQSALDSLSRAVVSADDRNLVRRYFSSLDNGR